MGDFLSKFQFPSSDDLGMGAFQSFWMEECHELLNLIIIDIAVCMPVPASQGLKRKYVI